MLLYDISDLPMFLAVPHVHLSCVLLLYAGWGNDGTNLHISPRILKNNISTNPIVSRAPDLQGWVVEVRGIKMICV